MTLVGLAVVLIVIGVLLWLVNRYIPMDAKIKQILNVVVIIVVVLWLIGLFFGGFQHIVSAADIKIPTFNGCSAGHVGR